MKVSLQNWIWTRYIVFFLESATSFTNFFDLYQNPNFWDTKWFDIESRRNVNWNFFFSINQWILLSSFSFAHMFWNTLYHCRFSTPIYIDKYIYAPCKKKGFKGVFLGEFEVELLSTEWRLGSNIYVKVVQSERD